MPNLTTAENDLLKTLGSGTVIGKGRMKEANTLIHRLMNQLDSLAMREHKATLLANGFWLTASGVLTEAQINANPQLTEQERADMLALLQLRFDAVAWREHTGFDLPNLPSITDDPVQEYVTSFPSLTTRSDD